MSPRFFIHWRRTGALAGAALASVLTLAACSSDETEAPAATAADAVSDVADDVPGDTIADTTSDSGADALDEVGPDTDSGSDAGPDGDDAGPVDPPWVVDAPQWSTCPDGPSTTETLAEKAAHYGRLAMELHVHPELKWLATANLKRKTVDCETGECEVPAVDEAVATWEDVESYETDANDGLWNALYMTAMAYRYAVTKEPAVLAHLELLMEGEVDRMKVTGVPGLFARRMIRPGMDQLKCPEDPATYIPDVEKDDDRWVYIGDDGCVQVTNPETMQLESTTHCGLDDYKNWCFYDNVSQDEYSGHVYALGAILRLVDDAGLHAKATELLEALATHMMDNQLEFIDWDGRRTEHGQIVHPGMALGWVKTAADASGNPELMTFYEECLLQSKGENACIDWLPVGLFPLSEQLILIPMLGGGDGCKSNWNNIAMALTSLQNVLWTGSEDLVGKVQDFLATEGFEKDHPKALLKQNNPWYNFFWAVTTRLPPRSGDHVPEAVHQGVCALKRYPASNQMPDLDTIATEVTVCESRLGKPMSADPQPPENRCPTKFRWWFNPYRLEQCDAAPWRLVQPQDYLLAYWMGRYYGFISEDQ